MSAVPSYPARVEGRLDPELGRWLWLVKWLLAIPHYLVLAFLWIAFVLLTLVALVAILFTGRYPRAIFDFNVGVLRWTWRVGFYTFGAFATDRYPPFSLADDPRYPASFDVEYPEQLSRGLALVKWWLLAIPHYLIVGVLWGGSGWVIWRGDEWVWTWGGGLIALVALIAAVALLFTGRYPRGIFDFVMGLDRWVLRVAAYASLMTDRYPPFRLDQGGSEAGPHEVVVAGTAVPAPAAGIAEPGAPAPPPGPSGGWSGGRIALMIVASIVGLVALGLLVAGVGGLVVDRTQREDGFVTSPNESFETSTHALVSETAEIEGPDWAWRDLVGTVRVRSESDGRVFLGIARAADVRRYLRDVEHEVVHDLRDDASDRDLQPGGTPTSAPGEQDFWVASAEGSGDVTLDWDPEDGTWAAVLMNADGSPSVEATLDIGAELDALPWVAGGLLAAGVLVALLATALGYAAVPKRRAA